MITKMVFHGKILYTFAINWKYVPWKERIEILIEYIIGEQGERKKNNSLI